MSKFFMFGDGSYYSMHDRQIMHHASATDWYQSGFEYEFILDLNETCRVRFTNVGST
jgi:hypothetical protein